MTQDFTGTEFTTFEGVVEGRNDPAMIGRVRVRIFGLHNEDKTESLPWAQVLLPVTGFRTSVVPKEGEWVFGYFQDGKNRQHPVILGVHPGILPKPTTITETLQAGNNFKVSPLINTTAPTGSPQPPAGIAGDVPGEPTTARIARGVMAETIVNKQNNDLAHVCDFISEMQKNMKLRQYMRTTAQAIRNAIRDILLAMGVGDATGKGTWAINMLKAIARELRWFNKTILKPIQDFEKYVLAYTTKMRAIIQWIMELPTKFLTLLQDCLSKFMKLVVAIFTDTIGGVSEGMALNADGDFSELIKNAKDVANAAGETLTSLTSIATTGLAIPVAATAGILQPVSQSELESAKSYITSYESSSDNKVISPNADKKAP